MKKSLDFGKAYSFGDTSPLIYSFDKYEERYIRCFSHTFNRIKGALTFISKVGGDKDINISESFLKASLGEFVSAEDTIKEDSKNANIQKELFKLHKTDHPIFHILKEIRNYQFHLKPAEFQNKTIQATLASNRGKDEKEIEYHDHTFLIISNFGETEFRNLHNSKFYDQHDITQLISWFEQAQNEWGISDLVWRCINLLVAYIVDYYDLRSLSELHIKNTIDRIKNAKPLDTLSLNEDSYESLLRFYFADENKRIDEEMLLNSYDELLEFGFSFGEMNKFCKWFKTNKSEITRNLVDAEFDFPEEKYLPFVNLYAVLNILEDKVFESKKGNLVPNFRNAIEASRENRTPHNTQ